MISSQMCVCVCVDCSSHRFPLIHCLLPPPSYLSPTIATSSCLLHSPPLAPPAPLAPSATSSPVSFPLSSSQRALLAQFDATVLQSRADVIREEERRVGRMSRRRRDQHDIHTPSSSSAAAPSSPSSLSSHLHAFTLLLDAEISHQRTQLIQKLTQNRERKLDLASARRRRREEMEMELEREEEQLRREQQKQKEDYHSINTVNGVNKQHADQSHSSIDCRSELMQTQQTDDEKHQTMHNTQHPTLTSPPRHSLPIHLYSSPASPSHTPHSYPHLQTPAVARNTPSLLSSSSYSPTHIYQPILKTHGSENQRSL